jgi:hypothetical protein
LVVLFERSAEPVSALAALSDEEQGIGLCRVEHGLECRLAGIRDRARR